MTDKKSLHITGKDSAFVDCYIEGVKDDGQGTTMIGSRIFNFRKNHPNLWTGGIISFLITVIGGVVLLVVKYEYFVK